MLSSSEQKESRDAPLDVRLCDFDNVSYHVLMDPDQPGMLQVSMTASCFPQLEALGIQDALKSLYGDLLVAPVGDANVTLRVDLSQPIADKGE